MTDHLINCERWQEPISLLAAGCLPTAEEAEVRRHLAGCAACAARFTELAALCASVSRGRPSAAVQAAAIRDRWNGAALDVRPRRPVRHTRSLEVWLGGALAASLLIAALWLVHRRPGESPPVLREPWVAAGGAKSGTERAPLLPGPPQPLPNAPSAGGTQPTLRAYELALAQSDEAFEALLERHGESIVFEPYNPNSLLQESFP